jgi:hypothetical protein
VTKDETADGHKILLAKAARIFGLSLLSAFLIYFVVNVVFACATFAAAGVRHVWQHAAAIQPPRLNWEPPSIELIHPFSYEYRGLNYFILVTFIPIFFYLIQSRDSRLLLTREEN